ncbi:monovalent cation/H+ antiporter complex subunit F [Jatrophihabitans cynanchi]|uniref:Monovalent cation/H+ antiporter complex subunit F n=1 Tax=Jatrophihabitans cynanchi TaxID=2944128 RepID=A0ABY7JXR5_9ACTN|nr:monovalent cation/H+ antiporter complex subunit F [Jatrophihabitans sp. SB3-54]WAX56490.1 monovalent cation/H+ antiporter complex subunit F [Jatrophihabitans sp. SB3-54]
MKDVYIAVCIAEVAIIGLLLVRLARGPSVSDRIVALNTISIQCALAVLFFAAFADRSFYLDVGLWMVSFSYLGALVWARYLERGLL